MNGTKEGEEITRGETRWKDVSVGWKLIMDEGGRTGLASPVLAVTLFQRGSKYFSANQKSNA